MEQNRIEIIKTSYECKCRTFVSHHKRGDWKSGRDDFIKIWMCLIATREMSGLLVHSILFTFECIRTVITINCLFLFGFKINKRFWSIQVCVCKSQIDKLSYFSSNTPLNHNSQFSRIFFHNSKCNATHARLIFMRWNTIFIYAFFLIIYFNNCEAWY